MSRWLVKRGKVWHYRFRVNGVTHTGSTRATDRATALLVLENGPRIRNQQVAGSSPVVGSKETPRGTRLRGVFVPVLRCWIMRNCGESLPILGDQVIQN